MINYNFTGKENGWKIEETTFNSSELQKTESIFTLGNGYLGLRSSSEENYCLKKPGLFINGTFDKFANEVSELPNSADLTEVNFRVNGVLFSLDLGKVLSYSKSITLNNGELKRSIVWEYAPNKRIELLFSRFVSMENIHVFGQKIEFKPLDEKCSLEVTTGINGQITNNGTQHFEEINYRAFNLKDLFMKTKTAESDINFYYLQTNKLLKGNSVLNEKAEIIGGRRQVKLKYKFEIEKDEKIILEKMSTVITSRDIDFDAELLKKDDDNFYKVMIKNLDAGNYDFHFKNSAKEWQNYWKQNDILIDSKGVNDQLLVRFAIYHLRCMTPFHDERLNVAAKGLSGEGYKGHTFWDTEMFVLPYYLWQNPEMARKLLINRYLGLQGARKKAQVNNYKGAMYPWEVAWYEGGEETPIWGAPDVVSGKQNKIWSGFIEQHITSCVAFGVMSYAQITGDTKFMEDYGYEILFDTAKFWISRLEYNEKTKFYEINNVVGPDEYKEHVNNNAFTNYMAWWVIKNAISHYESLAKDKPTLIDKIDKKVSFVKEIPDWVQIIPKIYLPQLNNDSIMPQDDTYLTLKNLDLTNYKYKGVGKLFKDYSLEQVNNMQVSKQTDVLFLFYLLEHLWDNEVKKKNFEYYESRTLHDSSLSLSTHTILASDLGDKQLAYYLFSRSFDIDLGGPANTSDDGIHSASTAGICLSVLLGFCGLRNYNGVVRLNPNLPDEVASIKSHFYVNNCKCDFLITKNKITIEVEKGKKVKINILNIPTEISGKFELDYN